MGWPCLYLQMSAQVTPEFCCNDEISCGFGSVWIWCNLQRVFPWREMNMIGISKDILDFAAVINNPQIQRLQSTKVYFWFLVLLSL